MEHFYFFCSVSAHPHFDDKTFLIIEWPFVWIFHFILTCLIINKAASACLGWSFKSQEFHKWYSLGMSEQNNENSIWTSCENNYLSNFGHFCLESDGHVCQECCWCFGWVNPYDGLGCECRCFHFQNTHHTEMSVSFTSHSWRQAQQEVRVHTVRSFLNNIHFFSNYRKPSILGLEEYSFIVV